MVPLEQSLPRFRQWAAEFADGPPPVIDQKLVHKHRQENVFVSRIEQADDDHPDDFIGQLYLDSTHPFFFEHPLDHYPGLMLLEAGRQFGTALTHIHYRLPIDDTVFILNRLEVDFGSFAEIDVPVFGNSWVTDKKFKRGRLVEMLYQGNFIQNEQPIGYMKGRWSLYSKAIMHRMRRAALKAAAGG